MAAAKPNPNPKSVETKMDSSSLRLHVEEENYSSAPESPLENNQREKFPPLPPLPPPPSLSYGSVHESTVENNLRQKSSPSPPPPPPPGSGHESPAENNLREKKYFPPLPPLFYGSAHENPVENNQREKKSSPPLPSLSYGSTHESPVENNQREKKFSPPLPPLPPFPTLSNVILDADRYSYDHGSLSLLSVKELPPPEAQSQPQPQQRNLGVKPASPVVVVNKSMREELAVVSKVDPVGAVGDGFGTGHGHGNSQDGVMERGDRRPRVVKSIVNRSRRDTMMSKAALAIRVCEVVFCLVSFSVMGADKTRGWAGDSFDRYKEYRYCITVNILGFVYAGFQMIDMAYHLITAQHIIRHPLRFHLDFSLDQMMTYLLISASSAAATRVDDWVSNWGKDEFTEMASASIAMSFLAFFSFGISSLISGYHLCIRNFT